ncbi:MAG: histidine kinase N-terminal 7TM domain-containing protein [Anaerolineae bacterium]
MPWTLSPCAIVLLVSAAASGGVALYAWNKRGRTPYSNYLIGLALAISFYCLGYAGEVAAPDVATKLLLARVQYFGLVAIPPLFFDFTLHYIGVPVKITLRRAVVLGAVPTITVFLAATNEFHRLIWTEAGIHSSGVCHLLVLGHGPAFWAFSAYSYGLLLLCAGVLANAAFSGATLYRRQSQLLLVGLIFPLLCNLSYALGVSPIPHLNPTPIAFVLTMLLCLIGVFRLRLLDMGPIARQALVERLRDAVLVVDERGYVADLNPAMALVLGRRRRDTVGAKVTEVLRGWPELAVAALTHCEGELELSHGLGSARHDYLLSVSYLAEQGLQPGARVLTLRDVTQQKALQRQAEQALRLESVARLAGGVAHDFNNLLTAINGHADLARVALPPEHPVQQDLDRLLRNVERARQLTRQLLAFSRQQPLEPQILNLNDLLQDAETLFPHLARQGIVWRLLPAPDLGLIYADPTQLEQVLTNLILNAADAMPQGGTVTVETANRTLLQDARGLPAGEYVALMVSDTGTGMDEETLAHLFEPFFTTKEVGKGTGLGLATVHGIVEQHRGAIQVESSPGQGTRFTILLPRHVPTPLCPSDSTP